MKIQTRLMGAAAPIALSIALISQPAFAQEEPEDTSAPESGEVAPPEGSIVVTGSRIRRDEFSAPAPVTIVEPDIAVKKGTMDTAEMLQGSPIAAGSSQITSAISSNFVTNGGFGAQTISLRGLGAERTLVLLNGRRAGPAGTRGAVASFDLNVLPQSIMERVDILKDGASSIYGSDAVAGVVNLITKTDTDGVELNAFGSVGEHAGGEQFNISATWGKTFDRGHILISGDYYRRNELTRGDRKYLQCEEDYVFTDDSYGERADLVDPRTGQYHCGGPLPWGQVWVYDYSYYYSGTPPHIPGNNGQGAVTLFQYSYPGDNLGSYIPALGPRSPGQVGVPDGWYPINYDAASAAVGNYYHPRNNNDTVIPKTNRYTIYLDGSYEITDSIEAYAELLFNRRETYQNGSRQVWQFGFGEFFEYQYDDDGDGIIDPDDPVGGFPGDPFAPGWVGAATFSPTAFTDRGADNHQEVNYYRAAGGFRGDITKSWNFDVYGQYSLSDGNYSTEQILDDSVGSQDFRDSSCVGTTTPIGNRPCVDVDWYSPRVMYGDFTPEEARFLFDWETGNTKYTQWYVEGVVTGDLFELPAGTVGVALGATYREDKIDDVPGEITLAGNAWGNTGAGITAGTTETKEAFGEIKIPILQDVPFFQMLEFSGAARITDVKAIRASDGFSDSDKGNLTYKLGLNWEVNDWVRLRGTYGTSYRAPALFEQFLADQTSFIAQRNIDPCIQWGLNLAQGNISQQFADNCAADGVPQNHTGAGIEATVYTGGGIGVLEPETSKAWTASLILTPEFDFLPDTRISLAIDYFDIEVNGEIAQLGPQNIIAGCYASDFFPNEPLCDLFARVNDLDPSDPDWNSGNPNNIARTRDSFINVNSQKNRGVDVTARIAHDFSSDTTLSFQAQMTWQTKDETALFSGQFESDNGEAGDPVWVGDFRVELDHGPWNFFYGLDVVGGTDDTEDWLQNNEDLCPSYTTFVSPSNPTGTVCLLLTTDAQFYHSASVTREFGDQYEVTFGVSNITNNKPPRVSQVGGNGITTFGQGAFYSQYDVVGRRAFLNLTARY